MQSVRWLTLRLNSKQSIGPELLQEFWSSACESNGVAVTRERTDHGVSYGLHAAAALGNPRKAELRMRKLLEEAGYVFSLSALSPTRSTMV